MTLSQPVKIVALAGLALALALGALLAVASARHKSSSATAAPATPVVVHTATRHVANQQQVAAVVHHKAPLRLDPNLPAPLRRALLHSREVVAVVYSSVIRGDRATLLEARAGARSAHVGFAALNVYDESVAAAVARWTAVADPAVLIVRRPGTIKVTLGGVTDHQTVAQAAATAR